MAGGRGLGKEVIQGVLGALFAIAIFVAIGSVVAQAMSPKAYLEHGQEAAAAEGEAAEGEAAEGEAAEAEAAEGEAAEGEAAEGEAAAGTEEGSQ